MMKGPTIKGYCPSAYEPMASGDGLLVRLKPRFGRFSRTQMFTICDLSIRFGSGIIDLTNRANLQIRGVTEATYPPLLAELAAADLIQPNARSERLNLMVSPFADAENPNWQCAAQIYAEAEALADLPAKFGFIIDTGQARYLHNASGDIRIETAADSTLILRCDGQQTGFATTPERLMTDIFALTDWFAAHRTQTHRRMRHLAAKLPTHWTGVAPTNRTGELPPGCITAENTTGQIVIAPYGQIPASALQRLVESAPSDEIHLLPNRGLMIQSGNFAITDGFITTPDDPRFFIEACPGLPACKSASIKTRQLADDIAGSGLLNAASSVHISGCSKGCASAKAQDICIVGRDGRYDIIKNGCAWHDPSVKSLSQAQLLLWLT